MLVALAAVAVGGGCGTVLRFGAARWLAQHWPQYFYVATLAVNVLGCLLMGYCYGLLARLDIHQALRDGLLIGFLGGLTTFSSFSLDSLRLLQSDQLLVAIGYVLLSVAASLLATWAGLSLTKL